MSRDPRRPPQGGAGVTHVCHIKATTSLACVKGRHANQPWYLSCTILYKTKRRLGEKNQSGVALHKASAPATRGAFLLLPAQALEGSNHFPKGTLWNNDAKHCLCL